MTVSSTNFIFSGSCMNWVFVRILNGFFKSFGSEFSLLFLDSVLMFSLLCLRVGIHFAVCGNLSASETPGHWKLGWTVFRKLETLSLGLLVTSALCFHTWGFWSNHFRLSMEFWSILIETGRQVELCFANETLEQTKLWKRDSVCWLLLGMQVNRFCDAMMFLCLWCQLQLQFVCTMWYMTCKYLRFEVDLKCEIFRIERVWIW